MREKTYAELMSESPVSLNNRRPERGLFELTYRCNLDCIHCYCKGSQELEKELTTEEIKDILDQIQREGCLEITLTGGEPLIREDFLEIYSLAKEKGFIISIFTNGLLFTKKIIEYLVKSPPFSIEITLNGISEDVYEGVTQAKGSFKNITSVLKELTDKELPLILKSNCLKENKNEISKIKTFADELLGKSNKRWRFKYDPMLYPCLNGDKTPTDFRLSPEELLEVKMSDPEIWEEYEKSLYCRFPDLGRDKDFLYRCNGWLTQFFINPYGRLKFCQFSEKFGVDLRKQSFAEGFYNVFPQLLKDRFKTNSKCRDCTLRPICYHCPARAYLETGDEEAPVEYYCKLAKGLERQMKSPGLVPDKSAHQNEVPILQ